MRRETLPYLRVVHNDVDDKWRIGYIVDGHDVDADEYNTKREAVNRAKEIVRGGGIGEDFQFVRIYKRNGKFQKAWFPEGQRVLKVQTITSSTPKSILDGLQSDGSRPFWELTTDDGYTIDYFVTKSAAKDEAERQLKREPYKYLKVYKADGELQKKQRTGWGQTSQLR